LSSCCFQYQQPSILIFQSNTAVYLLSFSYMFCSLFRQSSGYCIKLLKTKLHRIYTLFEISQLQLIRYDFHYYWHHDTSYSVLWFVKSSITKNKLLNQLICYFDDINRNDNCNEWFIIMRFQKKKVYILCMLLPLYLKVLYNSLMVVQIGTKTCS